MTDTPYRPTIAPSGDFLLMGYLLTIQQHHCLNCQNSWRTSEMYKRLQHTTRPAIRQTSPFNAAVPEASPDRQNGPAPATPADIFYNLPIGTASRRPISHPICFECIEVPPPNREPYLTASPIAWDETLRKKAIEATTPVRTLPLKASPRPSAASPIPSLEDLT